LRVVTWREFNYEVGLREKRTAKKAKVTGKVHSSSPMNLGLLEQIVALMRANDLNVVEVQDGDKRVTIKRGGSEIPVGISMPAAVSAAPAAPAVTAATPPVSEDAGLVPIKSPMVGTFYSASSPDAKPFVSIGSVVDDETDVCIIEAMKVFNNIKAETRGTIAKVLVQNGQTVEFGQTLFLVRPA
jgi:acetyl-CoA carboxylase biotin carboxyl carrier protein